CRIASWLRNASPGGGRAMTLFRGRCFGEIDCRLRIGLAMVAAATGRLGVDRADQQRPKPVEPAPCGLPPTNKDDLASIHNVTLRSDYCSLLSTRCFPSGSRERGCVSVALARMHIQTCRA